MKFELLNIVTLGERNSATAIFWTTTCQQKENVLMSGIILLKMESFWSAYIVVM